MHDRYLDNALPIPGLLQEAYKRVPKRSTPVSYGWQGKQQQSFGGLVSKKADKSDFAGDKSAVQSVQLIKAGRMPFTTEGKAPWRLSDDAETSNQGPYSEVAPAAAPGHYAVRTEPLETSPHHNQMMPHSAAEFAKQLARNLAAAFKSP